jgi:hypothetical protein
MHTSGPLRLAADVFRRRASQVAPTTPRCRCDVSVSVYSPPGLLLVELFEERPKAVARVPRQPQRPTAASALRLPPVPSHGLSRRRCGRSRTQPVTLRIGSVPCRLNGALPQPPAHPWRVSRVEKPVAARATARPSRLVMFGIHRPTRAHRRTLPRFQCLSLKRGYYDIISQPQRAPFWPFQRMLQMRFLRMRSPVSVSRTWVVQCHAHRRRDPCNPISPAWRCFKLARHSHTYGMAPRRRGHVFAAVYRSWAYRLSSYVPLPYQGCPGRSCVAVRSTLP